MSDDQVMFTLDESEQVTHWYNIVADLPTPPPPPLHPGTREPVGPADLAPLFPIELIMQEVTGERYVEIPGPVLDVYKQYRPSPLFRARRWEQKLGHAGPDLLQVRGRLAGRLPQDQHLGPAGLLQLACTASRRLTTETGAGQWGTALSYACALFGVECEVWQVGASYDTKPQRRTLIEVFGGTVHRSPSRPDRVGQGVAEDHPGSLGIAISEAVEVAAQDETTQVRPRVGAQPRAAAPDGDRRGGAAPAREGRRVGVDLVVGCAGGGSNFAGLAFPFLREKLAGNQARGSSPSSRARARR